MAWREGNMPIRAQNRAEFRLRCLVTGSVCKLSGLV